MRGSYAPPRWLRGESTWRGAREASSTWRLRRPRAWSTGASREASTLHSSRKSTSLSPTGRRVQSHHLSPGPKRRTRPRVVYPALQESAAPCASVRFRMPSEKRRASRLRLAAEGEGERLQPGAGPPPPPRHAPPPALHLEATAPWYRGALGEEEGQARPAVGHVEGVQLRHPRVGHEVGQQHHFVPVLVEVPPVREDECAAARPVCARCEAGEGPGTVHPGESVRAPDTVPPGVLVVRVVPRENRPLRGGADAGPHHLLVLEHPERAAAVAPHHTRAHRGRHRGAGHRAPGAPQVRARRGGGVEGQHVPLALHQGVQRARLVLGQQPRRAQHVPRARAHAPAHAEVGAALHVARAHRLGVGLRQGEGESIQGEQFHYTPPTNRPGSARPRRKAASRWRRFACSRAVFKSPCITRLYTCSTVTAGGADWACWAGADAAGALGAVLVGEGAGAAPLGPDCASCERYLLRAKRQAGGTLVRASVASFTAWVFFNCWAVASALARASSSVISQSSPMESLSPSTGALALSMESAQSLRASNGRQSPISSSPMLRNTHCTAETIPFHAEPMAQTTAMMMMLTTLSTLKSAVMIGPDRSCSGTSTASTTWARAARAGATALSISPRIASAGTSGWRTAPITPNSGAIGRRTPSNTMEMAPMSPCSGVSTAPRMSAACWNIFPTIPMSAAKPSDFMRSWPSTAVKPPNRPPSAVIPVTNVLSTPPTSPVADRNWLWRASLAARIASRTTRACSIAASRNTRACSLSPSWITVRPFRPSSRTCAKSS